MGFSECIEVFLNRSELNCLSVSHGSDVQMQCSFPTIRVFISDHRIYCSVCRSFQSLAPSIGCTVQIHGTFLSFIPNIHLYHSTALFRSLAQINKIAHLHCSNPSFGSSFKIVTQLQYFRQHLIRQNKGENKAKTGMCSQVYGSLHLVRLYFQCSRGQTATVFFR